MQNVYFDLYKQKIHLPNARTYIKININYQLSKNRVYVLKYPMFFYIILRQI